MEFVHSVNYTVEPIHLDRFGRVKPSVYLYFAQEAAEDHCHLLGTDWNAMAEKGLFWAVIRQRIEVLRQPRMGEKITVQTWPMPTTRVAYPRATAGFDEQGQEIFRVISLWVIMDVKTRQMVLPGNSGVTVEGTLRGCEMRTPPSLAPKGLENSTSRSVVYSELDRNGHMNNTRYLDWLSDLLPSSHHRDNPPKAITVCYHAEALEGQQLRLDWGLQENVLTLDAHLGKTDVSREEKRIFTAKMEF